MPNVGATTEDTIAERIALAILPTYLEDELAIVDEANNALVHSDETADFETPYPAIAVAAHVNVNLAHRVAILVVATGQSEDTGGETQQIHDQAPHQARLPRLDLTTSIAIVIRATCTDGESQDWARRVCNRVARAVRMILGKYTEGDAPDHAPPLDALWADIKSRGDSRGPTTDEEAWVTYARRLDYDVRTVEYRS